METGKYCCECFLFILIAQFCLHVLFFLVCQRLFAVNVCTFVALVQKIHLVFICELYVNTRLFTTPY